MDSNMILMITLAVVLMLVFYKPQQKIEGFDTTSSIWANAPDCNTNKDLKCAIGSKCIKSNGIAASDDQDGKCLICTNNDTLLDTNTPIGSGACALGPVPFACPECQGPQIGNSMR